MPRLSVVLPVRNSVGTIDGAVRSTLRAMPGDAELVVLDDASTDGTGAVLDRITDPRLRVLRSDEGCGVAGGLALLLASTDSEIVARMDGDDRCLPGRFRRQLKAFADDPSLDAVFTSVIPWRDGRVPRPDAPIGIDPDAFPLHLLVTNPASHPAMAARRDALDAVGGYRDVPAEDYDLWLRLAATGRRLRRLPWWGLLYAVHDAQVTASSTWRTSSWRDPRVASAYAELHHHLLGRRGRRLVTIASDPSISAHDRESEATEFLRSLDEASRSLRSVERRFLLDKASRRWRQLRDVVDDRAAA